MPQFPKAFCHYSREASRNRTVRKVLSDYYCIILGECYKYPGAPLDITQLPRGAGSAPLCACGGCRRRGSEAAAGCGGILGHNLMGGHGGGCWVLGLGPSQLHLGDAEDPGAGACGSRRVLGCCREMLAGKTRGIFYGAAM